MRLTWPWWASKVNEIIVAHFVFKERMRAQLKFYFGKHSELRRGVHTPKQGHSFVLIFTLIMIVVTVMHIGQFNFQLHNNYKNDV